MGTDNDLARESCSCPYCDEVIVAASNPCGACGVTIFYCPECRKPVPREKKVCPECGAEIKGEKA